MIQGSIISSLQLQGWRANCDIQVVVDYHACVEYLAQYASRSPVMKLAFNSIVRNCNNNSNPTKVIMKSLGQRDFSAQETMHHLMSLKLVSSSFNVVPISLNGSRRINTYTPDGDNITNDSLLDTVQYFVGPTRLFTRGLHDDSTRYVSDHASPVMVDKKSFKNSYLCQKSKTNTCDFLAVFPCRFYLHNQNVLPH